MVGNEYLIVKVSNQEECNLVLEQVEPGYSKIYKIIFTQYKEDIGLKIINNHLQGYSRLTYFLNHDEYTDYSFIYLESFIKPQIHEVW